MKKLLIFLFMCFSSAILHAQNFSWAKALFTTDYLIIGGSDVDSAGNVYITGMFSSTTDFDPGTAIYNLTPADPDGDAFIAKYNANGDFEWAQSFGGSSGDRSNGIVVDKNGFIYITGYFRGVADLDPGPGVFNATAKGTNLSNADIFIMKLTNAGTLVWAKTVGGIYHEESQYIQVDGNGNVIFLCKINAVGDFDPGPDEHILSGIGSAFVKLDANGNFIWAAKFSNFAGTGSMKSECFKLDASGNIYVTGDFSGMWDFNPGPYAFYLSGGGDIFICKLHSDGSFAWAKSAGSQGFDEGIELVLDSAANVYITGNLRSSFDFDPGPGSDMVYHSGNGDCFLWKLSSNGIHQWVKHFKGSSTIFGTALDIDQNNQVYMFGHFVGTIDINPGTPVWQLTASGNDEGFVAKFSPGGDMEWAVQTTTSTPTWLLSNTIQVSGPDQLVMIGSFSGTVDFDPGSNVNQLTSIVNTSGASFKNAFIWKLSKSSLISGTCYFDANGDGLRQDTEFGLSLLVKGDNIDQEFYTFSDTTGQYILRTDTGTYNISVPVPTYYQLVSPSIHSANLGPTNGSVASGKDFGLKPAGNINDLEISITNLTAARPGRVSVYRLSYANHGTTILSGEASLILDSRMNFISAEPIISNQNANTLSWNFFNLKPTQIGYIDILCGVDWQTTPGYYLNLNAFVTPSVGDSTPLNNSDNFSHLVTASYDPNDKSVKPSVNINPSFINLGNKLEYTIRFQNTGNDTAFVVILKDTLSQMLDLNSLEMVSASHPYEFTMNKIGAAEWRFDNILLPDSNVNEPKSHGFVKYRIKPKTTLTIGDSIKNKASIYFDYNDPVVTNETTTRLELATSVIEIEPGIISRIFPNPAKSKLYIEVPGKFSYKLFSVAGRLIASGEGLTNKTELYTGNISKGIYFMQVLTSKGNVTHKLMIK